ncbi:hypothetical protein ACYOEI_28920 [Singulisphaera rosea]
MSRREGADTDRVLKAIRNRIRPLEASDLAVVTKLKKGRVKRICRRLVESGVVEEYMAGVRGPFYR